jgi:spermidine synthase
MSKRRKNRPVTEVPVLALPTRAIFAAFFLSGVAGLMHQVVWARLLVGLIGNTAHAQAAVLAVFMGGLAIGSVCFGRTVDARGSPLRIYIALEIAIAVYCLLLPLILLASGSAYVAVAPHIFDSSSLTLLLRLALAIAAVLLPAVLMGGTLPILSRYLVRQVEETRRQVASLYAVNSFGAVLGAGLAGFITLPLLGLYPSLVLASLLNIAAAVVVLQARDKTPVDTATDQSVPARPAKSGAIYRRDQYAVTLFALALSGFAAMGYEVLFTRVIALSFGSSTYSFSVMLMSFITGIASGSWIISRIQVARPLWLLGVTQLVVVVALLCVTPLISRLPYLVSLLHSYLYDAPLGFELYQLGKTLLCLVVLVIPATCLGFSFPLVAQIHVRQASEIGYRVGSTYAWNTTGNVLGALLTSLFLLPQLGLLGAFQFNFALNLMAGMAILLVAGEVSAIRRTAVLACTGMVVVVYAVVGSDWLRPVNFAHGQFQLIRPPNPNRVTGAAHPLSSFAAWQARHVAKEKDDEILYFEEDSHTSVLVRNTGQQRVLYVNGKADASSRRDLPTQILLAQVPMFLAPQPGKVLVIGHGSGITAGSVLRHPVESLDIVEISRAVLDADRLFLDFNYRVLSDERVQTWLEDGQSFLRSVPRNYDVIISEPSNPWIAGVGDLFTEEYFETMKGRLNEGGLAVVWFHQYGQSRSAVELVLRTLGAAFDHVMVWRSPTYMDIMAVASVEPFEIDFEKMEQRFDRPEIRNDLARMGVSNLASLLVHQAVSPGTLRQVLPPGPLNTTGRQRLQYLAPRALFRNESSDFLQSVDPLHQAGAVQSDLLLDRYVDYRRSAGEPVATGELAYLAAHSKESVRAAIAARGVDSPVPATRPARGLRSKPEEMDIYEAAFWASRLREAGRLREADVYQRRALALYSERE